MHRIMYVGHYPLLAYFAVAENESIGRERYNFMQVSQLFFLCKIVNSKCVFLLYDLAKFLLSHLTTYMKIK